MTAGCPTEDDLERWLRGAVGRGAEAIDAHLSECESCRRWLGDAKADEDLIPDLRRLLSGSPRSAEAASSVEIPGLARYRVLRQLGEGGMGIVYEAEQRNPVRRVALKILHPGLLTDAARRRFDLEARALARLDHPGIARIFEADTFALHGRPQPFFAMELVEGSSLIDAATARGLDAPARLDLLVAVCEAVQHAHQKGIVHRDLKPANILVGRDGGPKILDFGVARIVDEDAAGSPLLTRAGQVLGTPAYMSPEQLGGDSARVDTRTDVWSLGVIGHELLAGRRPFEVTGLSFPDAARRVAAAGPPRLDTLDRRIRGDLEAVLGKALEADLARRYATAAELGQDLRRIRTGEPVSARAPSAARHLALFARRHRTVVVASATALAVLVVGLAATLVWMFKAKDAERRAVAASDLADRRREETEREGRQAIAARDFLQEVLFLASPEQSPSGREFTVRDALEEAARRVDRGLLADPSVRAAVLLTLGRAFIGLGEPSRAGPYLRQSLRLVEEIHGPEHREAALALVALAQALRAQGQLVESEASARRALALRPVLAAEDRALVADAANDVGLALHSAGRSAEAKPLIEEALALYRQTRGDGPDAAVALGNLAMVTRATGDPAGAERLWAEALDGQRRHLGAKNPLLATTLLNFGGLLMERGRLDDAEAAIVEAQAIREARFPPHHPEQARVLEALGVLRRAQGRPSEARDLLRTALENLRASCPTGHFREASILRHLAGLARSEGAGKEALRLYEEALAVGDRFPAATRALVPEVLRALIALHEAGGTAAQAAPLRERLAALSPPETLRDGQ